jgi:Icc-related predicted phosphoesterase
VRKKILFITSSAYNNVNDAIPLLLGRIKENETRVIALDSLASIELRNRNILHQTPVSYLNVSCCDEELTNKAVILARTWYKPFGDSLFCDEISLGEVIEYDFVYFFNDVLRSIQIAEEIINQFRPDEIFLPFKTALDAPAGICYEALVPTLTYLASLEGIQTNVIRPKLTQELKASIKPFREDIKKISSPFFLLNGLRLARAVFPTSMARSAHKKKILLQIPSASIKPEINDDQAFCYSVDLTVFTNRRPRQLIKKFNRIWEDCRENPEFVAMLKYKGIPLDQILRNRFEEYFSVIMPLLTKLYQRMQKNLKILNPDIVVQIEDVAPPNRMLSKVCNQKGIPVLIIQHGAVSDDIGGFHVMPLESNKQAVWGKIPQEWHVRRGKDIESQVITGNYRFDLIAKGYKGKREEMYKHLKIDRNKGVIVLATEWYAGTSVLHTWEQTEDFIRQALKALVSLSDKQIVVKLHPNPYQQYDKIAAKIANEEGIDVIITKDYLWELLSICDLLICGTSTVGIEAMFFAKPVILVNLHNAPEIPYASYGAAISARTPEEIESAIHMALNDSATKKQLALNQKRFLEGYTFKRDGQASKRVAGLIMEMVNYSLNT